MKGALQLSFDEALTVGEALHDRMKKTLGSAPLPRDSMGWGDLVQFVMREAQSAIDARSAK